MKRPEPVHVVKQRREGLLRALVDAVPYIGFLGIQFDRRGDELTAVLPYHDDLIGNPMLPALHGGATAGFLEIAAMIELSWSTRWEGVEAQGAVPEGPLRLHDFTRLFFTSFVDYSWSNRNRLIVGVVFRLFIYGNSINLRELSKNRD